ncbi:MAG TPA: hypothetical protein VG055_03195 [Planctomycetaceae bacterium]|nr:hypothetical protein [Planctomycetaceae bacterium]
MSCRVLQFVFSDRPTQHRTDEAHRALGATEPTLLDDLGRSASEAEGSFAAPPVLSRDRSWLAWRWAFKGASGPPQRGTVLFDLKNGEYRPLDQSWHAVTWAK